jgi:predicted ArsR family transcriptional regulator
MEADSAHGDAADNSREVNSSSGWVTTQQAARALGISARTVRWHIDKGNLEAKTQGEGVKRTWLVSIDSLQEFRDSRQSAGTSRGHLRASTEDAEIAPESLGNPIRELADRLAEEAARAAEYRVRLELTEQAQSTLGAELDAERRRREDAERERDELRSQLEGLREPRESPVSDEEGPPYGTSPQEAEESLHHAPYDTAPEAKPAEESLQPRSWWRRWFGA